MPPAPVSAEDPDEANDEDSYESLVDVMQSLESRSSSRAPAKDEEMEMLTMALVAETVDNSMAM